MPFTPGPAQHVCIIINLSSATCRLRTAFSGLYNRPLYNAVVAHGGGRELLLQSSSQAMAHELTLESGRKPLCYIVFYYYHRKTIAPPLHNLEGKMNL
jgi:hypothetical protein